MNSMRRVMDGLCVPISLGIWRLMVALHLFAFSFSSQAAEIGVTDTEIVIGQTVALTGPVSDVGQDLATGARVFFDALNARGGIHGRRIRLITMDDGYHLQSSLSNAKKMLQEDNVFALFTIQGTQHAANIMAEIGSQIPVFSPFSGANSLRTPLQRNLFHIRASYADEAEKLVQHLATVGVKRISVVYQDNSFGKDALAGVQKAMERRSQTVHSTAPVANDASNVQEAVDIIYKTRPEAILLLTVGAPTPAFIKAYNKLARGTQYLTTSVMATQSTIKALGTDGVGLVVSTIVPFPWSQTSSLAHEYRTTMEKAGKSELSFVGLEGYTNAKVFADALQLTGRDITRAKFIMAAEKLNADYGGFRVNFGPAVRQGSKMVELTIIGTQQRFVR